MKITFLGTGTSQGIPVIACDCPACISEDAKDKRLRTAALIEHGGSTICIDIGPDFRQQMLTNKVKNLDAVILTHEHNDHVIGADDLRPFNFIQKRDMPIYGEIRVLDELTKRFEYAFKPHPYPGIPQFQLIPITDSEIFHHEAFTIEPIRVMHGSLPILGYRMGDLCYLTDVKTIPEQEFSKLKDIKVLVINALRKEAHHSHLTFSEAKEMVKRIAPEKTYFTHFSHDLGPLSEWEHELGEHIHAAYDGLVVEIE